MDKISKILIAIGILGIIAVTLDRLLTPPVVDLGFTQIKPSNALVFLNSLILIALGLKNLVSK